MALSIEAIAEQSIPILTKDYSLDIDIGGAPTRAYVDGDMEGFYHEWDATAAHGTGTGSGVLTIKSALVTRLISKAVWNVRLVKGSDTLNSKIVFNVVPVAPVITDPGTQKLYKGFEFTLKTPVVNSPSVLRSSGLLTGLKWTAVTDGQGESAILIQGTLPSDANLTESSFMIHQYAENDGGTDTLDVSVTIASAPDIYLSRRRVTSNIHARGSRIRRVQLNGDGNDITSDLEFRFSAPYAYSPQGNRYMAVDEDYIYALRIPPSGVTMWLLAFEKETAADASAKQHTIKPLWRTTYFRGLAVDGSKFYMGRIHDRIYVYNFTVNPGTLTQTKILTVDGNRGMGALAIDGDQIVFLNPDTKTLNWVTEPSAAGNATVSIDRSIALPDTWKPLDITSITGSFLITDTDNDKIYYLANDGTLLATYTVPSAFENFYGIGSPM